MACHYKWPCLVGLIGSGVQVRAIFTLIPFTQHSKDQLFHILALFIMAALYNIGPLWWRSGIMIWHNNTEYHKTLNRADETMSVKIDTGNYVKKNKDVGCVVNLLTDAGNTSVASFVVVDWRQHQAVQRRACSVWDGAQWSNVWDRELAARLCHRQCWRGPPAWLAPLYCLHHLP